LSAVIADYAVAPEHNFYGLVLKIRTSLMWGNNNISTYRKDNKQSSGVTATHVCCSYHISNDADKLQV